MRIALLLPLLLVMAVSGISQTAAPKRLLTSELSGQALELFRKGGEGSAVLAGLKKLAARIESKDVQAISEEAMSLEQTFRTELAELSVVNQVSLPEVPRQERRTALKKLEALKGPKFEKMYLDLLVEAQQAQVEALEAAAKSTDPALSRFAGKSLPPLRAQMSRTRKLTGGS